MKRKAIWSAVLLSLLFLAGCASGTIDPSNSMVTMPPANEGIIKTEPDNAQNQDATPPSTAPDVYEADAIYVLKDNLKTMDETVDYQGIEYTINSIEFSKALGGRDQSLINYFNEELDASGNLLGAQSYIFINITIKNTTDETREELVNKDFVRVTDDLQLLETGAEARYNENPQPDHSVANRHHFFLAPGESATFEEIYIIDDEHLTGELHYLLGDAGSDGDNARNKFICVGDKIGR